MDKFYKIREEENILRDYLVNPPFYRFDLKNKLKPIQKDEKPFLNFPQFHLVLYSRI